MDGFLFLFFENVTVQKEGKQNFVFFLINKGVDHVEYDSTIDLPIDMISEYKHNSYKQFVK